MNKFLRSVVAWMVSHPAVEHLLEVILWAGVMGIVGYVHTTQQFTIAGIGMAFVLALKLAIIQQKGTILALLQDQLQALMNAPAGQNPAVTLSQVPIPKGMALSPIVKVSMVLLFLSFMANPTYAGYLISQPKPKGGESVNLALPSGTAIYLMPIEGFDVGSSLPKPTYGLSLNEDIIWGKQSVGANGATNFAPILGLGASLYGDLAGPVNGNGPLYLQVGVNAVGPDLDFFGLGNGQGLVPKIMYTHNFITNEDKVTGGLTVFADLGPGTAQKVSGN